MAKKRKPNAAFMKPMTPTSALAEVDACKTVITPRYLGGHYITDNRKSIAFCSSAAGGAE